MIRGGIGTAKVWVTSEVTQLSNQCTGVSTHLHVWVTSEVTQLSNTVWSSWTRSRVWVTSEVTQLSNLATNWKRNNGGLSYLRSYTALKRMWNRTDTRISLSYLRSYTALKPGNGLKKRWTGLSYLRSYTALKPFAYLLDWLYVWVTSEVTQLSNLKIWATDQRAGSWTSQVLYLT